MKLPRQLAFPAILSLVLSTSAACGDSEYDEDIKKICNAVELSGASDLDPSEKAMHMASWLKREIKSEKAMKFMQGLGSRTPSNRSAKLKSEANKAGLKGCPLADES